VIAYHIQEVTVTVTLLLKRIYGRNYEELKSRILA